MGAIQNVDRNNARPLAYNHAEVDAGGFQVVAFANEIVGRPTQDLSRFPKLLSLLGQGKVELGALGAADSQRYTEAFFRDRGVLRVFGEFLPQIQDAIFRKELGKVGLRNMVLSPGGVFSM